MWEEMDKEVFIELRKKLMCMITNLFVYQCFFVLNVNASLRNAK